MRNSIVSVVGRPNVGKSTLFNKLIRKKEAITEDTPGVTRDRLYREAEWLGRYFMLVDTGGYVPDDDDIISKHIKLQAELAIDTSDLILFVVDGKSGIMQEDRDIAEILRKSGRPVIVVVNKIDTHNTPTDVYEFYELGFEHLMVVSAEQAFGLGDLLDEILTFLPESGKDEESTDISVAIVGKPNVGKSSLINRLLDEDRMIVTDIAGTTRDAIDSYIMRDGVEYLFIDTAGLRRKRAITDAIERYSVIRTLSAVDRSDICLLLIDATEGVTEQDTKIAGYAHEQGKAIIIIVNKWDLIDKQTNTMKKYEENVRNKLGFISYAPVHFMSVKTGKRVDDIFALINMVNDNYNLRISTGVLNEIISEAVFRTPPPTDKGQRLKIFYSTQASVRPPKILLFVNKPELMHFSYMRYLENNIRQKFGFVGTPLNFELRSRSE
ncbi:ribosome biogenesis GTPase Der [Microaceticoccus formicicus]|uniref:ribosome biogenesis GTPase Der n=1 Tax=Microaceticoccus formicicus TaxID=3118105 RepID=UPI003CD03743|nr:ribosome biogenesis GTPase Der [Peptoniphilaceae bacterium AMB_02]